MRKPLREESLDVDEEGVARLVTSPVDLYAAAPRERLTALVGKRRKGVHPGWVASVQTPSPWRRDPPCPHFGACGGCSLQHLSYDAQVRLKAAPLEARLRALGAEIRPAVPAPHPYFYRNKVEFSFGLQGEPGFRRRKRFDQGVEVARCLIAPPENEAILQVLGAWSRGRRGWNPRTFEGELRYFVLRRSSGTGQWLAVMVTAPGEPPLDLARDLERLGATGVLWAEQTSPGAAVVPDRETLLTGSPFIEEKLGQLSFRLSWRSFFQVNPPAYLRLLDTAREWVGQPESLLDLFCGIGTIGLYLAGPQARLVGVESVSEAVEDARLSALANQRQGEFHCALSQEWEDLQADWLVLDPPRSGCHPRLVRRLEAEGPAQILYISCNPERLLDELGQLPSYRLVRAQLFDFFPQTPHIEALCLLKRSAL